LALITPMPIPSPVVMTNEKGGRLAEHRTRFWGFQQQKVSVEVRGGCWSACTRHILR
jgi:hypothetical protein